MQQSKPNLPLTVGDHIDLWNKVTKEVKLKRFAGPFKKPPYDNFIQSPIGLAAKDNGKDTHLIFHLSYPHTTGILGRRCDMPKSVNAHQRIFAELNIQSLQKLEEDAYKQERIALQPKVT